MAFFRWLALTFALCALAIAGSADRAVALGSNLSSHFRATANIDTGVARYVTRVQKTNRPVRRKARPNPPRAQKNIRRNKPRAQKNVRPNKPRLRKNARPNKLQKRKATRLDKRRARRLARPDKPRVRRNSRPDKRRARRLARPDKPHVRHNKHRVRKHKRKRRRVFVYGGFVPYYDYDYDYYYSPRRYGSRCAYWRRRCIDDWGYRNPDYYACMRYHRCY